MAVTRTYYVKTSGTVKRIDNLTSAPINVNVPGTSGVLLDVETDPMNGDKVFVVGEANAASGKYGIYVSSNAGVTWQVPSGNYQTNVNIAGNLVWYEVFVLNSNIIFVAGANGYVAKSTDGGLTFNLTTQLAPVIPFVGGAPVVPNVYSIHFITPLIGVVGADTYVAYTSNGGTTWTYVNGGLEISGINGPAREIVGIHISANQQVIVAAGTGRIFTSTNGGTSFIETLNWFRQGLHLTWINDLELWGTGKGGMIVKSIDGGLTWTFVQQFASNELPRYGAHFYQNQNGFLSLGAKLESTNNGGTTRVTVDPSTGEYIYAVWTWIASNPCYVLTDCEGILPNIITNDDLSNYVNDIIKIETCPDTCWIVTESSNCSNTVSIPTITNTYNSCEECLPPVLPPPPVELITRRVKPGYYTNGCPPEYTEKVSCKFGDAMFDEVAKARYGITICCDYDLEKWWIKKELLNLKAIYDPALDCPTKVCYCYTIVQSAGSTDFKYINCDGNCTTVTLLEGDTQYVCSQTWPNAICPDVTDIYSIDQTTLCTDGQSCIPCFCYYIEASIPITLGYTNCAGEQIQQVFNTDEIYICAQENTVTVIEGSAQSITKQSSCSEDIDCLPCQCYIIKCVSDFADPVNALDCNNNPITLTIPAFTGVYVCLKQISLIRGYDVIPLTVTDCTTECFGECRCLEISATDGDIEINYLDCNNDVQVLYLADNDIEKICGKENSITVLSTALPQIVDLGTCPCVPDCFCYQVTFASAGSISYKECDGDYSIFNATAPQLITICAQENTVDVVSGEVTVLDTTTLCNTVGCSLPCSCYNIIVKKNVAPAIVSYYRCSDGQLVTNTYSKGVYSVCSIFPPTSLSLIIVSQGLTCQINEDCAAPCVCHKFESTNIDPVFIIITDCNNITKDVLLSPNTPNYYCVKSFILPPNVTADPLSFCNGTSICETISCPEACCCYSINIASPTGPGAIVTSTDCTGVVVSAFYANGPHFICAGTQPTIANNEGTVALIGNCSSSQDCNK